MKKLETREDVYRAICNASFLDMLGLFVGSGFTKSVLEGNTKYDAYTWKELLDKCRERMEIDESTMSGYGSYPEYASILCREYSKKNKKNYEEAKLILKSTICNLTNVIPEDKAISPYKKTFVREQLNISWVATTNYDMVMEYIFEGRAVSIGPNELFTRIRDMVPIYHIHGICNSPSSIVITNEDYTYMFRPNDYRQARLPFLMKESLVVMIGYALGDINITSAVDWVNNVYTNTLPNYEFPIIQLLYKDATPKENPYEENGVTVLEISDLRKFFYELYEYLKKTRQERDEYLRKVNEKIKIFSDLGATNINNYISNAGDMRTDIINFMSELPFEFGYLYNSYFTFIGRVMMECDERSKTPGAFDAYARKLEVIIDILSKIPFKKMPPSFFARIAGCLGEVASMVGSHYGDSWEADKIWKARKDSILPESIENLHKYALSMDKWENYRSLSLEGLLKNK